MSNVLHKTTMQYRKSVHTPDFMDGNWLINPVLPECDKKYWKIVKDELKEMTKAEQKIVDDAEKAKKDKADKKSSREQLIQGRMYKIAEDQLIAEGIIEAE